MGQRLPVIRLVAFYGVIFFTFLTVAMTDHPEHFQFSITNERVNCTMISAVLYAVVFVGCSVMISHRRESENLLEAQHLLINSDRSREDFSN